jgi:hypothetical protein
MAQPGGEGFEDVLRQAEALADDINEARKSVQAVSTEAKRTGAKLSLPQPGVPRLEPRRAVPQEISQYEGLTKAVEANERALRRLNDLRKSAEPLRARNIRDLNLEERATLKRTEAEIRRAQAAQQASRQQVNLQRQLVGQQIGGTEEFNEAEVKRVVGSIRNFVRQSIAEEVQAVREGEIEKTKAREGAAESQERIARRQTFEVTPGPGGSRQFQVVQRNVETQRGFVVSGHRTREKAEAVAAQKFAEDEIEQIRKLNKVSQNDAERLYKEGLRVFEDAEQAKTRVAEEEVRRREKAITSSQAVTTRDLSKKGVAALTERFRAADEPGRTEIRSQVEALRPAAATGTGAFARQEGAQRALLSNFDAVQAAEREATRVAQEEAARRTAATEREVERRRQGLQGLARVLSQRAAQLRAPAIVPTAQQFAEPIGPDKGRFLRERRDALAAATATAQGEQAVRLREVNKAEGALKAAQTRRRNLDNDLRFLGSGQGDFRPAAEKADAAIERAREKANAARQAYEQSQVAATRAAEAEKNVRDRIRESRNAIQEKVDAERAAAPAPARQQAIQPAPSAFAEIEAAKGAAVGLPTKGIEEQRASYEGLGRVLRGLREQFAGLGRAAEVSAKQAQQITLPASAAARTRQLKAELRDLGEFTVRSDQGGARRGPSTAIFAGDAELLERAAQRLERAGLSVRRSLEQGFLTITQGAEGAQRAAAAAAPQPPPPPPPPPPRVAAPPPPPDEEGPRREAERRARQDAEVQARRLQRTPTTDLRAAAIPAGPDLRQAVALQNALDSNLASLKESARTLAEGPARIAAALEDRRQRIAQGQAVPTEDLRAREAGFGRLLASPGGGAGAADAAARPDRGSACRQRVRAGALGSALAGRRGSRAGLPIGRRPSEGRLVGRPARRPAPGARRPARSGDRDAAPGRAGPHPGARPDHGSAHRRRPADRRPRGPARVG